MSKLVIGLAAFVLLAAGGALAGGAISDSSPDLPAATTGTSTGATITTADGTTTSTETSEDLSGPCDEAEHANDQRCTGGTITAEDDAEDEVAGDDGPHLGRGRGGEEHDRSGSNSGRD